MDDSQREFTRLLKGLRNGDKAALDALTVATYDDLRHHARRLLAAERPDHTLQPAALVHEAYIRLVDQQAVDCHNRAHFLGIAGGMMRRVLINHAHAQKAAKRKAFVEAILLEEDSAPAIDPDANLLILGELLERLSRLDPQRGRVVELRYFGGLTIEETAEIIGISPATVKREWSTARLWFVRQMKSPAAAL